MARLGLYQPFIEDRNVRRLYQLKVRFREREGRRVPMTVLVNRILDDFFEPDPDHCPDASDHEAADRPLEMLLSCTPAECPRK